MQLVTVQGSMQLEAKAAAAWLALVGAARNEAGVTPILSSPAGAYRSEELVVDMWRNPAKYGASQGVAKPISLGGGGSVHQNGRCIDVNNWAAFGDLVVSRGFRRSRRLDTLAAAHGFYPDSRYPNEPWHYEYGTTLAGGGMENMMDWGDSIPTRDPANGFASSGQAPVKEILAWTEARTKGLFRVEHRNPQNPQQTDGQINDIGTLVAYTEANVSYLRTKIDNLSAPVIDDAAATLIAQKIVALIQPSLDELPTNGEMGQALTSTVALVNEHADGNRDAIIAAIPGSSTGSSAYSLSLNIDGVPGTATGTATPQ